MGRPTLVFLHGAGEATSDGSPWTDDLVRALQRCGYDIDEADIRGRIVSPTYTSHVTGHLRVPDANPHHDLPELRGEVFPEDRTAFSERQARLEQELPPGFPLGGVVAGAFRKVSQSERLTQAAARRRSPEAAAYVSSLERRQAVRQEVAGALAEVDGEIVLVGHSLGSVVALDLLARLPKRLNVATFVTLGSPLAISLFRDLLNTWAGAVPCDRIGTWVNFYDPEDPVTGGLGLKAAVEQAGGPMVVDQVVENGGPGANHGSTRYLDHFVVARHIAAHLVTDEQPEVLEDDDELRRSMWFDAGLRAALRRQVMRATDDEELRARMAVADEYLTTEVAMKLGLSPTTDLARALGEVAPPEPNVALRTLVDLLAAEPFSPFDIPVGLEARHAALVPLGAPLGQSNADVLRAFQAVRDALHCQSDTRVSVGRTLVLGAAVSAVAVPGVLVGALAAPGLAGAAAFASGLSALGGGSMAAGLTAAAASGVVTTTAAAVALDRMSPAELVDSVVRMHAESQLLAKSQEWEGAANIREAIRSLRYESSRMAREHRAIDDGSKNAKGYEEVADSCRRALSALRDVLLPE